MGLEECSSTGFSLCPQQVQRSLQAVLPREHSGEALPASGDGAVDVLRRMCGGNESGLELGRREEDSVIQHLPEERRKLRGVRELRRLAIAHRLGREGQGW